MAILKQNLVMERGLEGANQEQNRISTSILQAASILSMNDTGVIDTDICP